MDVRFCTSPPAVGSGTRSRKAAATGSMRPSGIRLPAKNDPHAPVAGSRVNGSHTRSKPAKSPPRTAGDGTEKVFVSERVVRCPS